MATKFWLASKTGRLAVTAAMFLSFAGRAAADDTVEVTGWRMDGMPVHVSFSDPTPVIGQFNKAIADNNKRGKIISCSLYTAIWLGTVETTYAATCILQETRRSIDVHICYDTGVGEFATEPALGGLEPKTSLIEFTFEHCGGG